MIGDSGVAKLEMSCLTPFSKIAKFSFLSPLMIWPVFLLIHDCVDADDIGLDLFDGVVDDRVLFLFLAFRVLFGLLAVLVARPIIFLLVAGGRRWLLRL